MMGWAMATWGAELGTGALARAQAQMGTKLE